MSTVGTLNDNGYNLSDDATCTNGGTGSATNATLNLGALADNGGPTLTHLPGAGSDAIGAIPNGTTISNNGTTLDLQRHDLHRPTGCSRARSTAATAVRRRGRSGAAICPSWTVTTADELYRLYHPGERERKPQPHG